MFYLILFKFVKLVSKENFFFMKICIYVIIYFFIIILFIDVIIVLCMYMLF